MAKFGENVIFPVLKACYSEFSADGHDMLLKCKMIAFQKFFNIANK